MDALYSHVRVVDLALDTRSQLGQQREKNQRLMLSATKQALSIKLATTVGHFYVTLTLQNVLSGPCVCVWVSFLFPFRY